MPSYIPNYPIVAVTWLDAHGSATDTYGIGDLPHHAWELTTIGWLLRDDDQGVSVSNEYCGDQDYRGITFIPRALVKGVKVLKSPRKRLTKLDKAAARFDARPE